MSRYLRILEKANLEKDLFGGDSETELSADFFHAQELDQDEEVRPQPVEPVAVAISTAPLESSAPAATPQPAPIAERVSEWREELAQLLGLDSLPDRMRIGMCPLGRLRSTTDAAAALGQWIAARAQSPVLIVEASFDAPQVARFFRTRRLGLAEAMAAREPLWAHFVHDSVYPGLKVLPAGRNPAIKQLLAAQTGFRSALDELDKLFDCVIVLLPNPRVVGMEKLLEADSMDLVFPVIEPGRVTAWQASQARRKLAAGAARVSAALLSPGSAAGDAARMEHIAKQLGRSSVGDLRA
jgi:hypothetical protein